MYHLCYLCLVLDILRTRLFIDALWSPAGKGLTFRLSFVMCNCVFVTFPCGILGQVWYLILSIPDLCPLSYFDKVPHKRLKNTLGFGIRGKVYSWIIDYSQISVIRTPIFRNYWIIRRQWTVPNFFSIIYCNKTTNYSNFDYPKNSIFRSDSSVPIEEVAIKLRFKIRSPNVTHGDHDLFVWSSSIYTPE